VPKGGKEKNQSDQHTTTGEGLVRSPKNYEAPKCNNQSKRNKICLVLQAYMDDSGTHSDSKVTVLAGYFGGAKRWAEFSERWQSTLDGFGIKTEFHAKRFWARDPRGNRLDEYDGWDDTRANQFIDRLLWAIGNSVIYPFAVGVVSSEWNRQTVAHRRILTGSSIQHPSGAPTKGIFLAFRWSVLRTASYCRRNIKIDYIFDDDPKTSGWAAICYAELKKNLIQERDNLSYHLGKLTFADSRAALPFQSRT
jgi:hypothetical protein